MFFTSIKKVADGSDNEDNQPAQAGEENELLEAVSCIRSVLDRVIQLKMAIRKDVVLYFLPPGIDNRRIRFPVVVQIVMPREEWIADLFHLFGK